MMTRRVDDLEALGCEGISKSQICQELDVVVDGFLGRPLDGGPYPYLWLDALTQKVGEVIDPIEGKRSFPRKRADRGLAGSRTG